MYDSIPPKPQKSMFWKICCLWPIVNVWRGMSKKSCCSQVKNYNFCYDYWTYCGFLHPQKAKTELWLSCNANKSLITRVLKLQKASNAVFEGFGTRELLWKSNQFDLILNSLWSCIVHKLILMSEILIKIA